MQARETPPGELSGPGIGSGESRISRLVAIAGLLLALWVLAEAAFGQQTGGEPVRRRVEHFVQPAADPAAPPRAWARWTRIAVAPGRALLHRELTYPALGWSFHDVEEFGFGERRLVHRELGPRRGYSLLAEWNPGLHGGLAGSAPRPETAVFPAGQRPAAALPAAAPRLLPGSGQAVHSGSGQRFEQRFDAEAELCGPLLALEAQRQVRPGARRIRCLLPETGQPETLLEIRGGLRRGSSVGLLGLSGPRWVEWRRADGSLRQRAWFLGSGLIAFGSESQGPLFQRISAERFAALAGQAR